MIFFSSFFGLPRSPIILFAAIYNHKNNKIKPLKADGFITPMLMVEDIICIT